MMAESYEDVAQKDLKDLRDEVGSSKIQHKKITIYI